MRRTARLALTALAVWGGGCSWLWPTVVRTSPREPLFHTGFPLVGPLRLDGALCSLVSLGPDATRLVRPPEPVRGARLPEEACAAAAKVPGVPQPVRLETRHGPVEGYLFGHPRAAGVAVALTGLAMPADGWINVRLAEAAARRGLLTFAQARDETARPMYFDPVREARRAVEAAERLAAVCGIEEPGDLAFVGISMGGLEALLANREARRRGLRTRAAVLDPVLDLGLATEQLDGFWHGMAADAVQAYFRRILSGRYGEDPPPRFADVARRTVAHPGAQSGEPDAPSAWLCGEERDGYTVFLSDGDPVLGDEQRAFAVRCGFPLRESNAPGHTPLACRPELFDELAGELRPRRGAAPARAGAREPGRGEPAGAGAPGHEPGPGWLARER